MSLLKMLIFLSGIHTVQKLTIDFKHCDIGCCTGRSFSNASIETIKLNLSIHENSKSIFLRCHVGNFNFSAKKELPLDGLQVKDVFSKSGFSDVVYIYV